MKVPAGIAESELIVKRSKFLSRACGVSSREDAERSIAERRDEHPDARHVVYAFVIGDPSSELLGMSDDGEPRGTAGRPVLEVLKGSGVRNCLVTVVRYFGGTKLGTGGLVHAYGDAAKACLATLPTHEHRILQSGTLRVNYSLHSDVRMILETLHADLISEDFAEDVSMQFSIDGNTIDELQEQLRNVSRGTCEADFEDVSRET